MNNSIQIFQYPYDILEQDLKNNTKFGSVKRFTAKQVFNHLSPRLDQFRYAHIDYIKYYINNLTTDPTLKEIFIKFLLNVQRSYNIA